MGRRAGCGAGRDRLEQCGEPLAHAVDVVAVRGDAGAHLLLRPQQRLGEPLLADRFQDVIHGVDLERAHGELVVRGNEDHHRHPVGPDLADDRDLGVVDQHLPESSPRKRLVVGDQHADHVAHTDAASADPRRAQRGELQVSEGSLPVRRGHAWTPVAPVALRRHQAPADG